MEDQKSLRELLAPLDRERLHALVLRLVESDPSLIGRVEAQIGLLALANPEATPPPSHPVTVTEVRRELRSLFRGIGRGHNYGYAGVGSISGTVDQALQSAWGLVNIGAGRDALPVLEVITEEVWSTYEELDDSDGEGVPLFAAIGAAWTEALLSADLTATDRQSWGARVEDWRDTLADYGLEEGFEAAVLAAIQGWDYPPLVRVLKGQDSRESLWGEDGPPDWIGDEELARIRLNVLERAGRWDEYLRFADASGQDVAYASMLVRRDRPAEAVAYGLDHLATAEEALTLAKVLLERQEPTRALQIAEYGFGLQGMRALLATWTADLAADLGETTRALAAAELAVREDPTLERYQRARELAGDDWPIHRDALLDQLRGMATTYALGPVEIFLHEGLLDEAIAAVDRGWSHSLLARVADAALSSHPDWVITTSRREAEAIMDRGKSEYYTTAAHWVARARDAYRVAGRDAEWQAYLHHLLTVHGRKYRLVPLLRDL